MALLFSSQVEALRAPGAELRHSCTVLHPHSPELLCWACSARSTIPTCVQQNGDGAHSYVHPQLILCCCCTIQDSKDEDGTGRAPLGLWPLLGTNSKSHLGFTVTAPLQEPRVAPPAEASQPSALGKEQPPTPPLPNGAVVPCKAAALRSQPNGSAPVRLSRGPRISRCRYQRFALGKGKPVTLRSAPLPPRRPPGAVRANPPFRLCTELTRTL